MATSKQDQISTQDAQELWVHSLARSGRLIQRSRESRMRTMIRCDIRKSKASIYVPPDMSELQRRSLRYLLVFARQHEFQLVEDRRRVAMRYKSDPMSEKRSQTTSVLAKGLSELLKQLGMPGEIRSLTVPHRLAAESTHIPINKLIRMAAFSAEQAKHVVIKPNRRLLDVLNGNAVPIHAYGCKVVCDDTSTILTHFDSPGFRGIGYSAGKQYVMHVCLAGGPITKPELWAEFHTLTRTDFQFQLFQSEDGKHDFGLFYATFYIDLSDTPVPWWLSNESKGRLSGSGGDNSMSYQRAS